MNLCRSYSTTTRRTAYCLLPAAYCILHAAYTTETAPTHDWHPASDGSLHAKRLYVPAWSDCTHLSHQHDRRQRQPCSHAHTLTITATTTHDQHGDDTKQATLCHCFLHPYYRVSLYGQLLMRQAVA